MDVKELINSLKRIQLKDDPARCPRCGGPLTIAIQKDKKVAGIIRFCGPCYEKYGDA